MAIGDFLVKALKFAQSTVELTRTISNTLLDTAANVVIAAGEAKLQETCARSRKNLAISAVLNGAMLLCAALVAFFMPELKVWGLLAAALISYVILGRAVLTLVRFVRTTVLSYKELIILLIPVFLTELRKHKSFEGAIKETIRVAVRQYIAKVPEIAQKIHSVGSLLGAFPNLAEIENKAAEDFYPLVCRFLRVALVYNVMLFMVCYGVLVFIAKHFIFGTMLGMSFFHLYAYPFVYIVNIIRK